MKVRGPVRTRTRKSVTGRRRALVLGVKSAAVAALAVISLAPVGRAQAAGADSATIVGRVTFRDSVHQAKAEEVERLRWGRLLVEMRRGWDVYSANLDANGFFSITGPPGTYRLDYVRVGQLSEFVAPHEVKARAGQVTCLGTLEITVADLGRDLGNNNGSQMQVRDDCAALEPEVHRLGNADATVANIGGGAGGASLEGTVGDRRSPPVCAPWAGQRQGHDDTAPPGWCRSPRTPAPATSWPQRSSCTCRRAFESRNLNDAGNMPAPAGKMGRRGRSRVLDLAA